MFVYQNKHVRQPAALTVYIKRHLCCKGQKRSREFGAILDGEPCRTVESTEGTEAECKIKLTSGKAVCLQERLLQRHTNDVIIGRRRRSQISNMLLLRQNTLAALTTLKLMFLIFIQNLVLLCCCLNNNRYLLLVLYSGLVDQGGSSVISMILWMNTFKLGPCLILNLALCFNDPVLLLCFFTFLTCYIKHPRVSRATCSIKNI